MGFSFRALALGFWDLGFRCFGAWAFVRLGVWGFRTFRMFPEFHTAAQVLGSQNMPQDADPKDAPSPGTAKESTKPSETPSLETEDPIPIPPPLARQP